MIPQPHLPKQANTTPNTTPDPHVETCRFCGVVDRPLLSPGVGPHKCQVSCQHCGRFWRWLSLQAPSERQARRLQARLKAMQKLPPSAQQLAYLLALGDTQAPPQTMTAASARIDEMVRGKKAQP